MNDISNSTVTPNDLCMGRAAEDTYISLSHAEMHAGLHANWLLLLSTFKQKLKVSTNSSKIHKYKTSWKFVQQFSDCNVQQADITDIKEVE